MLRDLIIAMAVTSIAWMSTMVVVSFRLVLNNVYAYWYWGSQSREERVKLALWLSIPLMSVSFLLTRASKFADNIAYYCATVDWLYHDVQAAVYLPLTLSFLVFALWYVCDRAYGEEKGDRMWCYAMWVGIAAGAIAGAVSWEWVRCPGG